ncbi:MAG: TatD family hydrolase [Saprospiraceae bacterium]|nr:TatD family hydrolase [Saprospiraceae bacterium]
MKELTFIDTHAHIYADAFQDDRDTVINNALNVNVHKIVLPNIDVNSMSGMLALQIKYPEICYATIGLHPCDVKENYKNILNEFESQIQNPIFIGIGETGTDAYWDLSNWEAQKLAFITQLEWAKSSSKPIIIHSRNSLDENIKLVQSQQNGKVSGVFHCFGGNLEQAKQIIDLGFYLGIGGTISYKNNPLKEVISKIPLSSILLETDSPYLSPVPFRGKRNEPSYIPIIASTLAQFYQCPIDEIALQTTQNANKLFQF